MALNQATYIPGIVDQITTGYWQWRGETPATWDIEVGDTLDVDLSDLSSDGKQLAKWAFDMWETYTGIEFRYTSFRPDIEFSSSDTDSYAILDRSGTELTDAFINIDADLIAVEPGLGGWGYFTFLHEIGHALGLGHSGNYNGDEFSSSSQYDTLYASVMSYYDPTLNSNTGIEDEFTIPLTPMYADILAMREMYGDHNMNLGDTVYGYNGDFNYLGTNGTTLQYAIALHTGDAFNSDFDPSVKSIFTVLDDGGNDTFDASGYNPSSGVFELDLRTSGAQSDFGTVKNAILIAPGTIIENAIGTRGDDLIRANAADNRLEGGEGDDRIHAYGGDDHVTPGSGNDVVYLGDGDDYVRVGTGVEEFYGGDGKDYISYYDATGGVKLDLAANAASGSWAVNDIVEDFESASGSKTGGDTIYGTDGSNTIKTYGGNDKVYARKGNDKVYLGDGDDYVRAGSGVEQFYGGAGKDYISYYDSTNGVTLNLATNTALGSWAVNDTVEDFESASGSRTGGDTIYGTDGANTIKTYGGNDKVYAGKGGDEIYLGSGDDYVRVGGGVEKFDGGSGSDFISYIDASDGVFIDLRADIATGSWADNDTIEDFENASGSKHGDDDLRGTSGDNRLRGYSGDDRFYGRSGDDLLDGGAGDDWLDGGNGADILDGGSGADTFHFDITEDNDTIIDFQNNVDTIELDGFDFDDLAEAFSFAENVGDDVIFSFASGDILTIWQTTISQLQNDLELV